MGENQPWPSQRSWLGLLPEEASTIQAIPLNCGYNFAEPPYPKIAWTLLDLVSHARFPLSRTVLCVKWDIREFTSEISPLVDKPDRISDRGILRVASWIRRMSYSLLIAH